jgi:8-oxo-dGTP diphosphatase
VSPVEIHVVRHAKAMGRERWTGTDALRPLTKGGGRQAERLAGWFEGRPLDRLLSSPSLRCVQTLEPLVEARGLPIEVADELAEGTPSPAADALVLAVAAGGPAALCTHGDVMQGLVEELIDRGVSLAGDVGFEKGCVWVLEIRSGVVASARYVPAPSGAKK